MSNILVIKHGSLGDIVQISGVLKDIKNAHANDTVYFLTTSLFKDLFKQCPYVDEVLVDKRLPRWNIFYLLELLFRIKKINFIKCYDLQNSSRTHFYKNFFNIKDWSSSRSILKGNETKEQFDQEGVIERFQVQLERSGVKTTNTLRPDFNWACDQNFKVDGKYIYVSPFSSLKLIHKRWPFYKELIDLIKKNFPNLKTICAPGPKEIDQCKDLGLDVVLDNGKSTNLMQLSKVIKDSVYVISNDTGPAHIAAHLGCKGLAIFGHHTSPKKVSIETEKFKAIQFEDLNNLKPETVFEKVKQDLEFLKN